MRARGAGSVITTRSARTDKTTKTGKRRAREEAGPPDPRKADNAGGASEFGFRGFSELSGDWYWEQDAQFRLTFMSSRQDEKPGVDLAAYLGARRWDQPALNLTQADWDRHRAQLERHEPFRDFEIQCLADDGRMIWLSLSGQPVFGDASRFRGYVGVGRDITEHKRAEQLAGLEHTVTRCLAEAASAPEALKGALRAICEADAWDCADFWKVDDAAWVLRRFEHWSAPDMAPILVTAGRPADAALPPGVGLPGTVWQSGEPLWIQDATQDPRALRMLMPKETGLRTALVYPVRSGRRVVGVLDLSCRATRAPENRLLDTLNAIGNQIGQLLQRSVAEHARRESEARLRSLTNLSSDWYWEQDATYSFTRLEGRHVAGGDKDLERRLIGIRRWESGLQVEGGWEAHRAMLNARKPFFDVLMWRTMSDGRTRFMSVSGEPIFGADNSFAGYHGVGRDVSVQKRAEQMLRLEHEVARTLAAAEDARSGLKAVILALCEAERWDSGRYFRLDEAGMLRFQDGWCINDPDIDHFVDGSRLVWQSGKAVWSGNIPRGGGPQARPSINGSAAQGAFAFAVISDGATIGVLAFSGSSVRAPDEWLQQAVRVIGSQVGQFLRRKEAEASLREGEARFRSLTQMSSDFFWEADSQHRIASVVHGPNYPATQIGLGIVGERPWDLPSISPDEAGWAVHKATLDSHIPFRDFEFARAMPDGLTRYFSLSGDPHLGLDGSFLGYRGIGRDITEAALTRERIASLAYTDPLTGLANRTSLGPALEQAVERARRRGTKLAGVFMDLDGFKQVNDLYGHDAGDRFLVEVARRLRANLRAADVVARLGGDEFFVVLEDVQDEAAVANIVRKLLAEAVRPYDFAGGMQARISASIGVSLFPDNSADATGLVKHADMAMYSAKQAGKNGYSFFSALNGPVLRVELGRTSPLPAAVNAIARGTARASVAQPSRGASPSQEGE